MKQIIRFFKDGSNSLNENKYFIGFAMILVNIGARFIIDELDDDVREFISNGTIRKIFVFCTVFMATRDVFTSIILTIVFIVIINEFLSSEKDETDEEKKGGSFNKKEIEQTIQKLKIVQNNI
tara:strand:+ start:2754 stop:3122 length:369 start_codon:yes stop_codon:yes gene_type:complete